MAFCLSYVMLAISALQEVHGVRNRIRASLSERNSNDMKQRISAATGEISSHDQRNLDLHMLQETGGSHNAQHSDLSQGVHALVWKKSDDESAEGGTSSSTSPVRTCCCEKRRCSSNEIEDGAHEKWFHQIGYCCQFLLVCPGGENRREREESCESPEEKEIEDAISDVRGEEDGSGSRSTDLCHRQLHAFAREIRVQLAANHEYYFHGTAVDKIHLRKAATDIIHRVVVPGQQQFERSSIGANLFSHLKYMTLLWNGIGAEDRLAWKHKLGAAELSRGQDVAFARAIDHEDVKQLRGCSRDISHLWFVASATFASVAPEKPLVLLIGKDEDNLEDTQFWQGELQGVVENPPANGLYVITVGGFECDRLMPKLTKAVEVRIPDGTNGKRLRRKWKEISSYTCQAAIASMPNNRIGESYLPPTWNASENGGLLDFLKPKRDLFLQEKTMANLRATLATMRYFPREDYTRLCQDLSYLPKETADEDIQALVAACPNIQKISLAGTQVTDAGLMELVKHCSALSTIDLKRTGVTDASIKEFALHCKKVEDIVLEGTHVTHIGVTQLANHCPHLKLIDAWETDASWTAVTKELGRLCQLHVKDDPWNTQLGYLSDDNMRRSVARRSLEPDSRYFSGQTRVMTITQAKEYCFLLGDQCDGFYHRGSHPVSENQTIGITFGSGVVKSGWWPYTTFVKPPRVSKFRICTWSNVFVCAVDLPAGSCFVGPIATHLWTAEPPRLGDDLLKAEAARERALASYKASYKNLYRQDCKTGA